MTVYNPIGVAEALQTPLGLLIVVLMLLLALLVLVHIIIPILKLL